MPMGNEAEKKNKEPLKKFRISGETVVDAALHELATVLAEIAGASIAKERAESTDVKEVAT